MKFPKIGDAEAEYLVPGEMVREQIAKMQTTKARYLEEMAAAFILEVGVPASQIELVERDLPWPSYGRRYFYRVRDEPAQTSRWNK